MNMYVGPNKWVANPPVDATDKLLPMPETDDEGAAYVYRPPVPVPVPPIYELVETTLGVSLCFSGKRDDDRRTHQLKVDHAPFESLLHGTKKAEIRYDDRGYRSGDILVMRETARTNLEMKREGLPLIYTKRAAAFRVTHIQSGYGLPTDMVVLSVEFICGLNL